MAWWDTSGVDTTGLKPDQYHLKEGLIELNAPDSDYDSFPDSGAVCIGTTSGGITVSLEQTRTDIEVDQMRYPIGGETTAYALTVSTALSQFAIRNLRLWAGTGSQLTTGDDGTDQSSVVLTLSGSDEQPYKALRITTVRPTYGNESGTKYRQIELYKVKCYSNGDITLSRTDTATIPVVFVAYANDSDVVGRIVDRHVDSAAVSEATNIPWES